MVKRPPAEIVGRGRRARGATAVGKRVKAAALGATGTYDRRLAHKVKGIVSVSYLMSLEVTRIRQVGRRLPVA